MTDTFQWRPTSDTGGRTEFMVRRAQFGDGYSQSVADGINPVNRTWSMVFSGGTGYVQEIMDFLDAHVGQSFYFDHPRTGNGLYQCDGYSMNNVGGMVYTLTAEFVKRVSE